MITTIASKDEKKDLYKRENKGKNKGKNLDLGTDGRKGTYQNSLVLALLLLTVGTSISIHYFKVPPIMDKIGVDVGLSVLEAPWLMSIFVIVGILFSVPASKLFSTLTIKVIMLSSACLAILGSILGELWINLMKI